MHPMTRRQDFSEVDKAIKDLRQKDEQESNYPPSSDSSKTISRKAMEMEFLVHTICVFVCMDRVGNLVDLSKSGRTLNEFFPQIVSLVGNGDSLVNDGWCKQYTAPRTCDRRKHFLACGSRT